MSIEFQIAESSQVSRQPTEQEREERRAYLMDKIGADAWLARIEAMPDGEEKAQARAKYQLNVDAVERDVASGVIVEWVTTYRQPTAEEKRQRQLDIKEGQRELAAQEQEQQRLLGLARSAAAAVELGLADYLSLHPVPGLRLEDIGNE